MIDGEQYLAVAASDMMNTICVNETLTDVRGHFIINGTCTIDQVTNQTSRWPNKTWAGAAVIYKWNKAFLYFQEILNTTYDPAATAIAHFEIPDRTGKKFHFIAVANAYHGEFVDPSPQGAVNIYRWNTVEKRFVLYQVLDQGDLSEHHDRPLSAKSVEFFKLQDGSYCLAVAHFEDFGHRHVVDSYIYRWNQYGSRILEDGSQAWGVGFERFQSINTRGALDVKFLSACCNDDNNSVSLLVFANFKNETRHNLRGEIQVYRFANGKINAILNLPAGEFVLVDSLPALGAYGLESFDIPGENGGTFLTVANRQSRVCYTMNDVDA